MGDIIVTNNEHCHTEIRQHLKKDYKNKIWLNTLKAATSLNYLNNSLLAANGQAEAHLNNNNNNNSNINNNNNMHLNDDDHDDNDMDNMRQRSPSSTPPRPDSPSSSWNLKKDI